jgi:hypothetical protein
MGLVALDSGNGFTAGDVDTKGYFAAVPAFQKVWICDGRPYSSDIHESGYHKIDMVNTQITGTITGSLSAGDSIIQDTSLAAGIFVESIDASTHLIYRTTTTEFDTSHSIKLDAGNYITPSTVQAPPLFLNWTLTAGTFPDGGSNYLKAACG